MSRVSANSVLSLFVKKVGLEVQLAQAAEKSWINIRVPKLLKGSVESILSNNTKGWVVGQSYSNQGNWICIWFGQTQQLQKDLDKLAHTIVAKLKIANISTKKIWVSLPPDTWRLSRLIGETIVSGHVAMDDAIGGTYHASRISSYGADRHWLWINLNQASTAQKSRI